MTNFLMTNALIISKYVHKLSDENYDSNLLLIAKGKNKQHSIIDYHHHFTDGINPYYHQTENCLVIEESYGTISKIHTPFGYWTISANSSHVTYKDHNGVTIFSNNVFKKNFFENIKCDMICPEYQTTNGFFGPYWLVKSIFGIEIEYPKINLLPEYNCIYLKDHVNKNILKQYQKQLSIFYKNNYLDYKETKYEFDELLQYWITNSYISDINQYSKEMMKSDDNFEKFKNYFLDKINIEFRQYVLSGTKANIIFKMIYYAKINNNN
jgi:hypothetical protein